MFAFFRLRGDKAVIRRLNALPKKLRRKVLSQAMRKGMKIVKASVAAAAPRDTGKLARSAKVRAGKRTRKGVIMIDVVYLTKDFDDKHGYYPAAVQYGDSTRAPDPYMTRGYDAGKAAAKAVTMAEIRAGIEREVTKP
jgi:HK97 gp10 family phage protein